MVGDRWTLLVIRDVGVGRHRFDELLESLGIASNVLTDRLHRLVDDGVLQRVRYNERPERFEYHLTEKGLELGVRTVGADAVGRQPPIGEAAGDCPPAQRPITNLGAHRRQERLDRGPRRARVRARAGAHACPNWHELFDLDPVAFSACGAGLTFGDWVS